MQLILDKQIVLFPIGLCLGQYSFREKERSKVIFFFNTIQMSNNEIHLLSIPPHFLDEFISPTDTLEQIISLIVKFVLCYEITNVVVVVLKMS